MPSVREDRPEKTDLRKQLRGRRRQLSTVQVDTWSALVCQRVLSLGVYRSACAVGGYLPIDNEVDASPLLFPPGVDGVPVNSSAFIQKKSVYLPVVVGQRMGFVGYRPGDPLRRGAFGILEPTKIVDEPLTGTAIAGLDVLLIPLVGFDGHGNRLGFGGGFYDRLLSPWNMAMGGSAAHAGLKRPALIGLAFALQQVAELPKLPHDFGLDWVVTEKAIHTFAGN